MDGTKNATLGNFKIVKLEVTCTTSNLILSDSTVNFLVKGVKTNEYTLQYYVDKAKEIALSHAGLSADQVTFVQANMDFDDGIKKYDIEFYCNGQEYDYEINASNGQIIQFDYDMEYNYIPNNNTTNNQGNVNATANISVERAKEIALSHAGLASNQVTFQRTELDFDNGIQKYEIEFYYNYREYSYEIDANTGNILSYEQD